MSTRSTRLAAPSTPAWPLLTPEGRQELQARIDDIRAVRLPSLRPLLVERERDERDVREFERLLKEVGELEALVASADVIDLDAAPFDGRLRLGMRTRITLADDAEVWVRPVHPAEAHLDSERISMTSPLATAILGCRVGDLVWIDAPTGVWATRILEIDPAPEGRQRP